MIYKLCRIMFPCYIISKCIYMVHLRYIFLCIIWYHMIWCDVMLYHIIWHEIISYISLSIYMSYIYIYVRWYDVMWYTYILACTVYIILIYMIYSFDTTWLRKEFWIELRKEFWNDFQKGRRRYVPPRRGWLSWRVSGSLSRSLFGSLSRVHSRTCLWMEHWQM